MGCYCIKVFILLCTDKLINILIKKNTRNIIWFLSGRDLRSGFQISFGGKIVIVIVLQHVPQFGHDTETNKGLNLEIYDDYEI